MPPTLAVVNTDSLGEQIQRAFPAARVVKALNTVNAEVMVAPDSVPGEHVIFVCGDDDAAKGEATALLGELGWPSERVLDLGDITAARGTEMYLPLWLRLMGTLGTAGFNIAIQR
jgi:predicted dinucleotide-binding enzyme